MAVPSWFDEYTYLQSKLNQLISAGQTQYSNVTQVKAAIEAAGMSVCQHFEKFSLAERTSPNTYFNTQEYLEAKAKQLNTAQGVTTWTADKVALEFQNAGFTNAYEHFSKYGWNEGVNPSNSFDVSSYLEAKAAATGKTVDQVKAAFAAAGLDPIAHYETYGKSEGITVTEVPAGEQVTPDSSGSTGQTFTLTAALGENIVGTSGDDTINAVVSVGGVAAGQTLSLTDSVDGAGGRDTINILASGGAGATLSGTIRNVEVINLVADVVGTDTIATAIDFGNFSGAERINVNGDVVTEVSGLTADNSVNFVAAAGGVEANVADGASVANVVLTNLATGQTLAVGEVTAGDAETINVSGSVAGAGAVTIDLDTGTTSGTGPTAEDTLNLALTSDSAVSITSLSLVTIDASASTGDLTLDLETDGLSTVTSVLGGSGDDTIIAEGTVGAVNVTIDAGAGADTINLTNLAAGGGARTIVINAGDTGVTLATADAVSGFVSGTDKFDFNLAAGSATNFLDAGASSSFTDALTNAKTAFEADAGTLQYFLSDDGTDAWLFIDRDLDGTVDQVVEITGGGSAAIAATDIIA